MMRRRIAALTGRMLCRDYDDMDDGGDNDDMHNGCEFVMADHPDSRHLHS